MPYKIFYNTQIRQFLKFKDRIEKAIGKKFRDNAIGIIKKQTNVMLEFCNLKLNKNVLVDIKNYEDLESCLTLISIKNVLFNIKYEFPSW